MAQPYLEQIDSLLIMTVNPGFGGQSFIYETLPKIQQAAAWRREKGLSYHIGVDGGIDFKTAAECAHAGADTFISGTTLFGRPNLGAAVKKMRKIVEAARLKALASALEPPDVRNPQLQTFCRQAGLVYLIDYEHQIWNRRLAGGHRRGFHLRQCRARRSGDGGLLERESRCRHGTESHRRLRPAVSLGRICASAPPRSSPATASRSS